MNEINERESNPDKFIDDGVSVIEEKRRDNTISEAEAYCTTTQPLQNTALAGGWVVGCYQ